MRFAYLVPLAATALLTAAPAFAQDVDELVIYGPDRDGDVTTLSETVSYADLDLTFASDRDELRHRIVATARDVCRRLGEDPTARSGISRSCQDDAVRGAMSQMRLAVADAETNLAYRADAAATYGAPASAYAPEVDAPPVYDPYLADRPYG